MKNSKLKLLLLCTLVLLLYNTPMASALVVGFNSDIHQDNLNVVANDFHVEGRIESGDWGGNWSKPPVLVQHIDDAFPNFSCTITPDTTDPGQNWYIVKADWSGHDYPFCSILHLGLFFDATCHNVVLDLVGWWTKNGQPVWPPIPPPPPPPPPPPTNGGAVPIPGFNVLDHNTPQILTLHNDSQLFGGGGGGGSGFETEIVQMDLVSLTKEELEMHLGPIPEAFRELRVGGDQQYLPWVQVGNSMGPISESNPIYFLPDSFFDVFLDGIGPIHPMVPVPIPAGNFLISREKQRFLNNNSQYEYRWVWHIHEAHALKPLVEHSKWSQPPIEIDPNIPEPIYCGWDEPSYSVKPTPGPTFWKIAVDDFRCIGNMPITSVHWWGSYKGCSLKPAPG